MRQILNNFTPALNTLTDARKLRPNSLKDTAAESPQMENVEVTTEGSMITSTGYELVSSIAGTGGVLNLLNYDRDADNRFLIITHGVNHYSITPSASAWDSTNLGVYGAQATLFGSTVYLCTGGTRKAIIGNDIGGNNTKKADLTGAMVDAGGGAPDGYIVTNWMGRLFTASGRTLTYSAVDDETVSGGTIGFNDIITALIPEGKRLIVFTRTYNQSVFFDFNDSSVISVPLKEPYERQYGILSHKAVTKSDANLRYWGDNNRIYDLGSEANINEQGVPRPVSLSKNINPSLAFINLNQKQKAVATRYPEKYQWWLAAPYNTDQNNSIAFVYNELFGTWTTRTGFYPSDFALFRDSNYIERLYFGSAIAPNLYRFNDQYNYDGAGYLRRWKSKKFTGEDQTVMKKWLWIDISGAMYATTDFTVRITVDSNYKEYTIDNTHLQTNSFGEYIGDDFIGHALIGGSEPEEVAWKRFKAFIPVNSDIREGYEMEIMIYNDEPDEPWKIDEIQIEYDMLPRGQRRQSFINNNPSP